MVENMDWLQASIIIILLISLIITFRKLLIAWYKSRSYIYPLPFGQLLGMHLRKQDLIKMMDAYERINKGSLSITMEQVELFHLRGGKLDDLFQEASNCKNNYETFNYDKYTKVYFRDAS